MKFIIALTITLCIVLSAVAESPLQYVGSGIWAGFEAIEAPGGDYIYAGFPYGLAVFDVSDSLNCFVSEWEYLGAEVFDIVIEGGYVFAAAGDAGIAIIDISDPTDIFTVSTLDIGEEAYGIYVVGDYAIIAGKTGGVHVIDISTLTSPSEVGFVGLSGGCMDVVAEGDLAYVCRGLGGFSIIDFSTPSAPFSRGYYSSSTLVRECAKRGNYVFLAAELVGITVLDVSDPDSPTPAGTYPAPTSRSLSTIDIQDSIAFVGAGNYGVLSLNISDPASITLIDRFPMSTTSVIRISVAGGMVYFSTGEGLQVLDVGTDLSNMAFVSRENLNSGIEYVWGSGSKLLTASGIYGMDGFNMPSPETPLQTFSYSSGNRFYAAVYHTHYIYAAQGSDGLAVLRSTSLAEYPDPISTISIGGIAKWVVRVDTMLYVMSTNGVTQLNIVDPASPAIRWDAPTSDPGAIYATDDYVYVCDEDDGFLVLETGMMSEVGSDPSASGYEWTAMTILNDYAYAAAGDDGFVVFDISDPTSPSIVKEVETDDDAEGIAVVDGWLYVAVDRDGVVPYKIVAPGDSLIEFDAVKTGGRAKGIYASGNYIFVADRYAVIVMRNTAATIGDRSVEMPDNLSIDTWPNPFNAAVTIFVGETGRSPLRIEIFDISGRMVAEIPVGEGPRALTPCGDVKNGSTQGCSPTAIIWRPDENIGSGVYLVRARFSNGSIKKKVVYLK